MSTLSYETPAATDHRRESRVGLIYGLGAYTAWGLVPAYFKLLHGVEPIQILAHRVFWSVLFLIPLLFYRGLWPDVHKALRTPRTFLTLLASTVFISANWFTFIYAVSIDQVVQTSLGYYMNPLVVVMLGVFFLKERLRVWHIVSLALAAVAVVILTISQHRLPVISLVLAISFALYGYVRKTVDAGPMVGLFIETMMLLPIAVGFICFDAARHGLPHPKGIYVLLACAGIVTAVPLLWFANAAKRLRLATMGLLQYLAPTFAFLLAVVFFQEPFQGAQRVAFPMIWIALIVYSVDSYRAFRSLGQRVEEPVLSDL